MWKYLYLDLFFALKRTPGQIGQNPALELGRIKIAVLAIRKKLWGTYHSELVEGPLPSRSAVWSTPPDNDRFGLTFQKGVSKEYLAVLRGYAL